MPATGYTAWSVVFGEQPTATKWNYLGGNDAAFNTGTGFNDAIIIGRHLDANLAGGWIDRSSETWTYSSADNAVLVANASGIVNSTNGPGTYVINIPSDGTTRYSKGMRVKLVQSASTKYFLVTGVSATTLTVFGGTNYVLANSAISAMMVSPFYSPLGFPLDKAIWSVRIAVTNIFSQSSPVNGTWYNVTSAYAPIGEWKAKWKGFMEGQGLTTNRINLRATLSTANNSESNSDLTDALSLYTQTSETRQFWKQGGQDAPISVAVKTAFYLNAGAFVAGMNDFSIDGATTPTLIVFESAYL